MFVTTDLTKQGQMTVTHKTIPEDYQNGVYQLTEEMMKDELSILNHDFDGLTEQGDHRTKEGVPKWLPQGMKVKTRHVFRNVPPIPREEDDEEDERYDWVMDHIDKHTSMVKPNASR